jgi:hypothetical protein
VLASLLLMPGCGVACYGLQSEHHEWDAALRILGADDAVVWSAVQTFAAMRPTCEATPGIGPPPVTSRRTRRGLDPVDSSAPATSSDHDHLGTHNMAPTATAVCVVRGQCYEALENLDRAVEWYRHALALDPTCYEVFVHSALHRAACITCLATLKRKKYAAYFVPYPPISVFFFCCLCLFCVDVGIRLWND